jgi:hypothetical protein
MRKLILKMSMSTDGFVGGPKGEADWIFRTESNDAEKWSVDTLSNTGLHLSTSAGVSTSDSRIRARARVFQLDATAARDGIC